MSICLGVKKSLAVNSVKRQQNKLKAKIAWTKQSLCFWHRM